jgi:hypothetical protein|tara:strand:+ start:794 stop:1306 length:513 start_codon:yes stop_codon:yes gene_type:complete
MAGSLVQINKATTDGSSQSVQVTGINSDDVYLVTYKGIQSASHDRLRIRVTKSGSDDNTSEYDNGRKGLPANGTFQNNNDVDDGKILLGTMDDLAGTGAQGLIYCYNFNSSSEFSYVYFDTSMYASTPQLFGEFGGGVQKVASASDGLALQTNSSNNLVAGGVVTLYRVV